MVCTQVIGSIPYALAIDKAENEAELIYLKKSFDYFRVASEIFFWWYFVRVF